MGGQDENSSMVLSLRHGRRLLVALVGASMICALGFWVALSEANGASASAGATTTFTFTGGEQLFEVPDGVTSLEVVAVGGKGSNTQGMVAGGFGAVATGKLAVAPGQILFIEVGGNGGGPTPISGGYEGGVGGFNGGGAGGLGSESGGGGGGGGTDIRTISKAGTGDTLGSRLIIAGGGGGGGAVFPGGYVPGFGDGGSAGQPGLGGNGAHGQNGAGSPGGTGGQGGEQTKGGLSVFEQGTLGQGGRAGGINDVGGGGGGGGKWGGGGGQSAEEPYGGGAGGGGSTSFATTATNTSFQTDTSAIPLVRISYVFGDPSKSGLKYGKVKLNKNKGIAILPVTVPGSGDLSVGGKGVVKKRPGLGGFSRLAREVTQAGTYKLKIKAKGKAKRKLFATGKVKVKAVVTFKPTSGDAVHDTKKIRLKKN
jgi:hypothetical protein